MYQGIAVFFLKSALKRGFRRGDPQIPRYIHRFFTAVLIVVPGLLPKNGTALVWARSPSGSTPETARFWREIPSLNANRRFKIDECIAFLPC